MIATNTTSILLGQSITANLCNLVFSNYIKFDKLIEICEFRVSKLFYIRLHVIFCIVLYRLLTLDNVY